MSGHGGSGVHGGDDHEMGGHHGRHINFIDAIKRRKKKKKKKRNSKDD